MFDLTNKTAFITGGGGLLGRKHAEAIIEFGGTVILADCNEQAAIKVATELGEKAIPVCVDITNKQMIEGVIEQFPKIDILINNAAKNPTVDSLTGQTKFETMTLEYWLEGIDVALNGTFICSQALSNKMLENGGGVIFFCITPPKNPKINMTIYFPLGG